MNKKQVIWIDFDEIYTAAKLITDTRAPKMMHVQYRRRENSA